MNKEHFRQAAFLQSLLLLCSSQQAAQLRGRIAQARHEDRVMRLAVLIAILLGGLVVGTLGYAAVLAPTSFFRNSVLLRVLQALAMGSLISVVIFLGYWWWKRALFNALNEECRCFLFQHLDAKFGAGNSSEIPTPPRKVCLDS